MEIRNSNNAQEEKSERQAFITWKMMKLKLILAVWDRFDLLLNVTRVFSILQRNMLSATIYWLHEIQIERIFLTVWFSIQYYSPSNLENAYNIIQTP